MGYVLDGLILSSGFKILNFMPYSKIALKTRGLLKYHTDG